MRIDKYVILLFACALILSSCSSPKKEAENRTVEVEDETVESVASPEANMREPVYIYGKQSGGESNRVTLTINGEPLLLTNGYVRLVGVVSGPARNAKQGDAGGGRPLALVEIGGRGLCVEVGDKVADYMVVNISRKEIVLSK